MIRPDVFGVSPGAATSATSRARPPIEGPASARGVNASRRGRRQRLGLRTALLPLLVSAVPGCGSSAGTTSGGTVIDSTGRYPVARSSAPAARWTAQLEREVGGAAAAGAELGSVRSVLLGRAGELIVVDAASRAVLAFDSAGTGVRRIGREGAGPAEYRQPYSVAWLGDTLALLDPAGGRLGLFDAEGRWAGSWPVPRITGDQLIRLYRTSRSAWMYGVRRAEGGVEGLFIRVTSSGPADTVVMLRPPPSVGQGRTCQTPDGGISFIRAPFSPRLLTIPVGDGRQAAVLTSAYAIAIIDRTGDTLRVFQRDLAPARVSPEEWAAANRDWPAFRARWPTAACDGGDFARPGTRPLVRSLQLDDEDRLWVESEGAGGISYDVFDAAGRLLASVDGLPPSSGIDASIAGGRIAIAGIDEHDAPIVRVFRLQAHQPSARTGERAR